jgi:diadenosine tetraphosphate (Ap4A) HIT family hydrolase
MDAPCPLCDKLSRLAEVPDEDLVWQFPHSIAFLGSYQYHHGYCVLVSRKHVGELYQLPADERQAYLEEMCLLARVIQDAFQPIKMNYELLGNQVPHLHWHLFPRYKYDPEKLKPVWLAIDRAETFIQEKVRLHGSVSRPATTQRLRTGLRKATQ